MASPSCKIKDLTVFTGQYNKHKVNNRLVFVVKTITKLWLNVLFVFIILVFLNTCKKQENEYYSSDPGINEFVKLKKSELSNISLEDLLMFDIQVQRAIFNSWTPLQKSNAWRTRYHKLLETNNFNSSEILHIQRLINTITPEIFISENDEEDLNHIFQTEWLNYACNELKWTDSFIAFMVYRMWLNQDQFINELSIYPDESETDNPNPLYCNCYTAYDYCQGTICLSGGCIATEQGCGFLWSQPCDGRCR